jgi:hypothetical protein
MAVAPPLSCARRKSARRTGARRAGGFEPLRSQVWFLDHASTRPVMAHVLEREHCVLANGSVQIFQILRRCGRRHPGARYTLCASEVLSLRAEGVGQCDACAV